MNRWNAEADSRLPTSPDRNDEKQETKSLCRQQRESDELYGLHNLIVLRDLLQRHLNLH